MNIMIVIRLIKQPRPIKKCIQICIHFLLFILGLAFYVIVHLIIPIIVVKRRLTYQDKTLWRIAIVSGLFGFTVSSIIANDWFSLAGILLSSLLTFIDYHILEKHCSSKITIVLYFTDFDIKEKLKERREQGELSTPYIKRLIREDMKRD